MEYISKCKNKKSKQKSHIDNIVIVCAAFVIYVVEIEIRKMNWK